MGRNALADVVTRKLRVKEGRLAYGDIHFPTDAQKVHALACLLISRMPWWAGGGR
jgi:hypothetical protein